VDAVNQQNQRLIEFVQLDMRMHLMYALGLITLIGLVLLVFTSAGARSVRRSLRLRKLAPPADDWALRTLIVNPLDDLRDGRSRPRGASRRDADSPHAANGDGPSGDDDGRSAGGAGDESPGGEPDET
jgi:hypothetical protein